MDAFEIYLANAHRCRALADHFQVGHRGRAALIQAAEQWDLLANLAKVHSDPIFEPFCVDFAPPSVTLRVIRNNLRSHTPAEMRGLAFQKLSELGEHIAQQEKVIARLEENSEAVRMAQSVMTSYLKLRDSVLVHIMKMKDEPESADV